MLGHPIRLELLLLLDSGKHNVRELAHLCGISSHLASEHLRLLQRSGLLNRQRQGKQTFYRIAELGLPELLLNLLVDRDPSAAKEYLR